MVFYKASGFEQSVKMTPNDCLAGQSWLLRVIQVLECSLPFYSFSFHPQLNSTFLMGWSLPISCSHSEPLATYFLLNLCPVCSPLPPVPQSWDFEVPQFYRLDAENTSTLGDPGLYSLFFHSVYSWPFCIIHVSWIFFSYFSSSVSSHPSRSEFFFTAIPLPFFPLICKA